MKVVHIEARLKEKVILPDSFIKMLPKKVALFTTIQFMNSMDSMLEQLKKAGKEVLIFKTGHTRNKGQILGCNVQNYSEYSDGEEFDAFAYVGDGLFHPKALLWNNNEKKVFAYDPFQEKSVVVDSKEMELVRKKHMAALSIFYKSTKIGVIVTTKPGQLFLKQAFELEKEYPDKEFFYFVDNTINFQSLEDFPFVECWVNTACPRIGFDDAIQISKPVINLEEVKKVNSKRAIFR